MAMLWGCSVFNGSEDGFLPFACVEFEEGKIVAVTPLSEGDSCPEDSNTVNMEGYTVLPGFIDCEAHLGLDSKAGCTARLVSGSILDSFVNCIKNGERFLTRGVTTVRDLGDKACETLKLRDEINSGNLRGPRILGAGSPIRATGGHFVGYEVDGVDQARNAIRRVLSNGADVVKVITSSSHVIEGQHEVGKPELLQDEIRIVCDIAHSYGKIVASHAHCSAAVKNSVLAGVDTIEHGTALSDEIIELMLERGTWLVPTFTAYDIMAKEGDGVLPGPQVHFAKRVLEVKYPWFKKAWAKGVRIACGTDAGSPLNQHGNIGRELSCMMEMGLSASQALVTATSAAAEMLGFGDKIGSLKPGYIADMTVVAGNPLDDILAVEKVKMVYQGGNLVFSDGKLL